MCRGEFCVAGILAAAGRLAAGAGRIFSAGAGFLEPDNFKIIPKARMTARVRIISFAYAFLPLLPCFAALAVHCKSSQICEFGAFARALWICRARAGSSGKFL